MSIINQKYSFPPVNVERVDIEWLWNELTTLFQGDGNQSSVGLRRHVTITTGKGSDETEIEGDDLTRLLDGGFLRGMITKLSLSFSGQYRNPRETRSLVVSIDSEDPVEVRIQGVEGWIDRIRGKIDPYLRSKVSHNRRYRWALTLGMTGMIGAPFIVVLPRYLLSQGTDIATSYALLLILFPIVGVIFSGLSSKVFPLSRINITNAKMSWYTRWAEQILIAIIAGMLLSIIASALSWLRVSFTGS